MAFPFIYYLNRIILMRVTCVLAVGRVHPEPFVSQLKVSKMEHVSSLIQANHHNPHAQFKTIDSALQTRQPICIYHPLKCAIDFCSFSLTRYIQLALLLQMPDLTPLSTFFVLRCGIPLKRFLSLFWRM